MTDQDRFAYLDGSTLEDTYEQLRPHCEAVLEILRQRLQEYLEAKIPAVQVKGRVKRLPSILEKLQRKLSPEKMNNASSAILRIHDLLALRAVCPFMEDADIIVNGMSGLFEVLEIDHKGEERDFSTFGYDSTHLAVAIPHDLLKEHPQLRGFNVEIQVRTILQDAWAEVEHELVYKVGAHPLNEPIRRKLAALNATLDLSDIVFQEIRDYQKSNVADLARARENFLGYTSAPSTFDAGSDHFDIGSNCAVEPPATELSKFEMEKLLKKGLNAQISGELDDAIRIYTRMLSHSLDAFTASVVYNHRGMACESLERHNEALRDFASALERDPKNARAGINLAMSYRHLGRLTEAEATLRKVLEIKPNSAHAHYGLARVMADLGRREEAMISCLRSLKLDPEFTLSKKLREELEA